MQRTIDIIVADWGGHCHRSRSVGQERQAATRDKRMASLSSLLSGLWGHEPSPRTMAFTLQNIRRSLQLRPWWQQVVVFVGAFSSSQNVVQRSVLHPTDIPQWSFFRPSLTLRRITRGEKGLHMRFSGRGAYWKPRFDLKASPRIAWILAVASQNVSPGGIAKPDSKNRRLTMLMVFGCQ